MDIKLPQPVVPNKKTWLNKLIDQYPKPVALIKKYQLPIITVVVILIFISLSLNLFLLKTADKPDQGLNTDDNKKIVIDPGQTNTNTSITSKTSNVGSDNLLLKTSCNSALADYPEWTKADSDLVIWENPDKSFNYRTFPEDASTKLSSPVPPTETLADMDFIGLNQISYVTTNANSWKINTFKLNGLSAPEIDLVYEKNEAVSYINTSPINRSEYLVLVASNNQAALKRINATNSTEEIILAIPSPTTNKLKLAVSPKGTYGYLLQNNSLMVFEIATKKQLGTITPATSAVWVGDTQVLYSGSEGTFIYSLITKEKSQLDQIGVVSDLAFNPKDNGVIAFNDKGNTQVVNCQTWQIINTSQGAELKTLTSEKTAITKKGVEYGYWRFKNADWVVKILEETSKYVTIWQKY